MCLFHRLHRRALAAALLLAGSAASIAVPSRAADDTVPATVIPIDQLRRKQEAQQRARDLARELVSGILDVQLQQLEENGLQELPLYRDIRQMRANLDGLVEAEMNEVVALLLRAQEQPAQDREPTFVQARQKIRDCVVRLTIERQNLLRRLKTAELAAQVKRVINIETVVLKATAALAEQGAARRENELLATTQDQHDARALYMRLVEALHEVRGWGGEIGHGAAAGLSILRAARAAEAIDAVAAQLEAGEFALAKDSEQTALRALQTLLDKLEETQGLIGADREAALERVRALAARQTELRDQTRRTDFNDAATERLVHDQTALQNELGKLATLLSDQPATLPLAEQAKSAAYSAAGKLFDAARALAIAEQAKVLGSLSAIEQQLISAHEAQRVDKSAQEMAEQLAALRTARQAVDQATTSTAERPTGNELAAADPLAAAAEQLASQANERSLPPSVQGRLREAAEAAHEAAALVSDPEAEPGQVARSVNETTTALERAAAEINTAEADAERKQLALTAGELNRAAEALDRAAAVERRIARATLIADPLKSLEWAELQATQEQVNAVAEHVAEAVRASAPAAQLALDKARDSGAQTALHLAQVAARQPSQSPAPEHALDKAAAGSAATMARHTAEQLAAAAQQVRAQMCRAAAELGQVSERQQAAVTPVRQAVEQAVAALARTDADAAAAIATAQQKTRAAQTAQARAAGLNQLAELLDLEQAVAAASQRQSLANQAAEDLAQGKSATPFDAAVEQQQAAEAVGQAAAQAARLATASAAPTQSSLETARSAAAEAAQNMLTGNQRAAQLARQRAEQALQQSRESLKSALAQAPSAPPGPTDATAQRQVAELAADAAKAATKAPAPDAVKRLRQAAGTAEAAHQQLVVGQRADNEQQQTATTLQQAADDLTRSDQEQQAARRQALAAQQAAAQSMVPAAGRVDAPAQAALRAAQQAVEKLAAQPGIPEHTAAAAADVERALERAAASLTAREQRLVQDQALAEALQQAAQDQSETTEMLTGPVESSLGSERVATPSQQGSPANGPPKPSAAAGQSMPAQTTPNSAGQTTAAKSNQPPDPTARQSSMSRLAAAQNRAGQAAEEVAGQSEVANPALRDALGKASQLGRPSAENASSAEANMGTRFTPDSAAETARMVAGDSNAPAANTPPGDAAPPPTNTADRPAPGSDPSSARQNSPASSAPNSAPTSSATSGATTSAASAPRGAAPPLGQQTFRDEPWMAKLPPELRAAIQGQALRPAPRGYEERLKRYYESLE